MLPLSVEVDCAANSITSELILEVQEWKQKICVWNKQTTTSPSGCHLGHLKALQSWGPDALTPDDGKELNAKQNALIQAQ
eukprot:13379032-Ditylum_brightwellii.AAC.1